MGYCTEYELYIKNAPGDVDGVALIKEASELTWGLDEDGNTYDSCKWYSHEEDMKEFSKKYPEVTFELIGVGEEQPDMWKKYFKDGKMQVCKAQITYEEYDDEKLL